VRCERFTLNADPAGLAEEIRALVPAPASVSDAVGRILADVRARGDQAVLDYTRRFDTAGADPRALPVAAHELHAAARNLNDATREGLERAIQNVQRVAEAAVRGPGRVSFETHEVILREAPVVRAAVYVPGGRAPYPSTVVMGVATARVAGVREVVVCAPPGGDGDIDPSVLAAAELAGADLVYRMGGAQAVGALAYGTGTVTAVDVIVGPGNLYVQEAKRQVSARVGIDGFAGPSDLMVIADGSSDPVPLSLDLLAQAEHGLGTLVVGVSEADELLEFIGRTLEDSHDTGAVACLVKAGSAQQALALAQVFAPEHLQLVGAKVEGFAPQVTHAGCLFVGAAAATAFGDYIAGSNHILPTNGAARFASALSPAHFRRSFSEVHVHDATRLAAAAAPVARAEGFEQHARSMEARVRDNADDGAHR
jgi:histidinol dehydrogenase